MEIIKHSRKRAVKFTCTHCWCVFKEEHNKCMTGEHTSYSYASGEDAILHRVGLSWRGSRTTTQYYACMCPECGKMVETTVNDYHKQCHEEYEAEQKAEQQKKEEEARNAYWERQVERALNETESRRWHKERDDARILGDWEWYVIKLADQENRNKEKVRRWNIFKSDIEFYEKHPYHLCNFDSGKMTKECIEQLSYHCHELGITLEFALAHRTEEFPLTLEHDLYDPFTACWSDEIFAEQYCLGRIKK